MRKAVCAFLFLVFCPFLIAQQAMNNDAIVKMLKAGLSDDVIVATINASSGAYDTSPNGLIALKQAGVSDKVIAAIVAKGLVKQDLNGVVGGTRSKLVISTPVTIILHVPQGRSASDYQLLRLRIVSNNRQFLSVAGGLNKETAGALRDVVDFTTTQFGPNAYQIVLGSEIGQGEFGFLEPVATSSKTPPSSGKIFTFAIVN